MRITQQSMTQNIINLNKTSALPAEVKAMLGKVIQGQIIGIQNNQMATLATGSTNLTIDMSGLKLSENQQVNLKIVDYKDGAFVAKLVGDFQSADMKSSLSEMLSKLGISDQSENRLILDAMRSASIPITKENFQMLRQSMIEVKTLISELSINAEFPIDSELETPIKALAIKLIQQNANPLISQTQTLMNQGIINNQEKGLNQLLENTLENTLENNKAIKSINPLTQDLISNKPNLSTAQNTMITDLNNELIQNSQINVVSDTMKNTNSGDIRKIEQSEMFENLMKSIQLAFGDENTSSKMSVTSLLNQFDYKQGSLILKNDLQMTLKNIFLAYDALSEDSNNSFRFKNIIETLDKMTLKKEFIMELLNELTSDATQEEKMESIIKSIKAELPENDLKHSLERDLTLIKESSSMPKSLNEQMMVMQLPIPINEQLQNVEIFYKKGNKKADPNDITLLVALKTFNFGEVRCIVHKQNQNYTLNFNFENEEALNIYESSSEKLVMALNHQMDKHFTIHFNLKSKIEDDLELDYESNFDIEAFGFDVKV